MPRGVIDITIFGDEKLERALDQLSRTEARKLVVRELRESAKRLRPLIAERTPVDTGNLKAQMGKAKIRSASRKRGEIRIGLMMPTRAALNIDPDDKFYFPFALEYKKKPWIRRTVDMNRNRELAQIGRGIGRGIAAFWSRTTR